MDYQHINVYNFFKVRGRDIRIICSMRPEDGDLVEYRIGQFDIPDDRDGQLLRYLDLHGYSMQKVMAEELGWTNQSEVSRSLKRLAKMGFYDRSK